MKDLVILVADLDTEFALRGLLSRYQSLIIREISFDIFRHPRRDPGCLLESVDFLRGFTRQYHRAIVIFDHEGSGREDTRPETLEQQLNDRLAITGWQTNASTVIIQPELEIWVWSASPQVDAALGWQGQNPSLRQWLMSEGWISALDQKPERPKEALHASLRIVRKVSSASLFEQLARTVSFRGCTDIAFQRLLSTLRNWFAPIQ